MEAAQDRKATATKWIRFATKTTFPLFMFVIVIDWADQYLFSPNLNQLLTDFGLSETTPLGMISTMFMITSAIGMVIFGILADRHKRKGIVILISIAYGLMALITFFTPLGTAGYWYLFATRSLSGFGLGAIVPAVFSMVGDSVSPKRRGLAFAIFSASTVIGQLGGMAVAGAVPAWRLGYLYIGIFELVLGVCLIIIQEPKRGATEIELQKTMIEGAEYRFKFSKKDLKPLLANKTNKWIILNFVDTIPSSMLIFIVFKYLEDFHNVQASETTIMLGIGILGGVIGNILGGIIGDKWVQKNKKARAIVALFCTNFPVLTYIMVFLITFWAPDGAGFDVLITFPQVQFMIIIIFITMLINQGMGPNFSASVLDVNLPEHRATMISFASFADLAGKALGPLIGAIITDLFDPRITMIAVAIFWAANTVFWIPIYQNIDKDMANVKRILEERAITLEESIKKKE